MQRNMKLMSQERRKQCRYICCRIPDEGIGITLIEGTSDFHPVWVYLMPLSDDELSISTNEPEWIDLGVVYDHLRSHEMTHEEMWRALVFVDPAKDYYRKVKSLSQNERELLEAASDTTPATGEQLAFTAGHNYCGQIKGRLSLLKKLGLILTVKGGYLRRTPPNHPYSGRGSRR